MFETILNTAKPATINEGDFYGEDGILYCGKCKTPKQAKIMVSGHEFKPAALCQCEQDRIAAEKEAYKRREFEDMVQRNRDVCFPDRKLREWTFEADDGTNEITKRARGYVEKFDEMREKGRGILLFGAVGTGKTFAAACIANALLDQGKRVLMTNFSRIANKVQDSRDRQDYLDSLNDFDLLILDDLEAERSTDYMSEIVHSVINARYNAALPLIITTNATAEEIKNPTDIRKERVYSRILEMCYPIQVKGEDRRREKLRLEYERSKQ